MSYLLVTSTLLPLRLRADHSAPGPLYGIYDVTTFDANGRTLEPLTTDAFRWRRIVFASDDETYVEMMDGSWRFYDTHYQPQASTVTLTAKASRGELHYRLEAGPVKLTGTFAGTTIAAGLTRVDESTFDLLKSRFRWINGEP